jgi:hypothetical protein
MRMMVVAYPGTVDRVKSFWNRVATPYKKAIPETKPGCSHLWRCSAGLHERWNVFGPEWPKFYGETRSFLNLKALTPAR